MAKASSAIGDWYREYAEGRILFVALAVLVITGIVLYFTGVISEAGTGLLVGVVVVTASCVFGVRAMLSVTRTPLAMGILVVACLGTFIASLAPIYLTLFPGRPLGKGELARTGTELHLPAPLLGPVRVYLQGRATPVPSEVHLVLKIGEDEVRGTLSRKHAQVRVGRRGGRRTVLREHTTETVAVRVHAPTDVIRLERQKGALENPLVVTVYRDWFPARIELWLDVVLILLTGVTAARLRGDGGSVAAFAVALIFGAVVHDSGTAEAAVKPEVGALLLALLGGAVGGNALAWLIRKIAAPRDTDA